MDTETPRGLTEYLPPAGKIEVLAEDTGTPRPLFNGASPQYELKRERACHRAVIMLAATAMTHREIGEALGISPVTVAYIVKQPWAREQILEEIEKSGRDAVQQLLQGEALASVEKLIQVRDSAEASIDVQRKAANDLLDRVFGKPNQPITRYSGGNIEDMTDAELASIAKTGRN